MILLSSLLSPDIGLMFWTVLIFVILLFLLGKFGWKPIVQSLKERDESIEKALSEAKSAREEIAGLKAKNEEVLKNAKIERDKMLKEAREKGEAFINEARNEAVEERKRLLNETQGLIRKEKEIAFTELKQDIADLVIETATKVIKKELDNPKKHQEIIENSLKELNN